MNVDVLFQSSKFDSGFTQVFRVFPMLSVIGNGICDFVGACENVETIFVLS